MTSGYCLKTKNHEGKDVVFTEKQRLTKIEKRAELRDPRFINGLLKEAIQFPDFIYPDLDRLRGRHVLYKVRYLKNGRPRYVKVVVNPKVDPIFVITAYMPDYVKERGKVDLIYGKDEYK